MNGKIELSQLPSSEDFLRTLGQITWLMSLSKEHRKWSVDRVEHYFTTPLILKQVRVYTKGKQPIAALSWAYVSEVVRKRIESGDSSMAISDWRSGSDVLVVNCVSPFFNASVFNSQFYAEVEKNNSK